jgi:capsular polysaccharide biosynthesis protein
LPGSETAVVSNHELGSPAPGAPPPAPDLAAELKRNWKLVVLPAIATMLIAWMIAALQPKRYRASSVAAVTPVKQGLQPSEVLRSIEALDRRTVVATVASLATTPLTTSKVMGAQAAGFTVSTAVLPNTNLFRVDVEGTDPAAVADIANRIPPVVSTQTRALFDVYGVTMVSAASRPTAPFAPRAGRAAAAGFVLGLIIGTALVYALHALRKRHALS